MTAAAGELGRREPALLVQTWALPVEVPRLRSGVLLKRLVLNQLVLNQLVLNQLVPDNFPDPAW
jgi:hypothetical protein